MTPDEYKALARPKKKNKFHNKIVKEDGKTFDSKAEYKRYKELQVKEKTGEISDLKCHTRWPLEVNGIIIGKYESDFDYMENGFRVVEDVKGKQTPLSALKFKHAKAQYAMYGWHIVWTGKR
jgi:hypothetical protein